MNYTKLYLSVFSSLLLLVSNVYADENPDYKGSGSETDTVNSFMTFPVIALPNIEYQLGKKRVFTVHYGDSINVNSFSAVVNGKNISNRFHPKSGETETVYLPLHKGINLLVLKISDFENVDASLAVNWDIDEFSINLNRLEATARHLEPPIGFEKGKLPPKTVSNNRPIIINKSKK